MAAIASLSLLLKADVGDFSKGLKKASDTATTFAGSAVKSAHSVSTAFAGMGKSAAGSLGSFAKDVTKIAGGMALFETAKAGLSAAMGASVGAVVAGIDRIDQLTDTASQLGVTTEALSGLRHAANLTGSSAEDLDGALEKLNANLGDAAQKGTPASDALARLGLDAKQLASVPADQAFRRIVGGFEGVPNAADKASIAMDIFGKGGLKILNTLGAGSGEIDRLADEAGRFGIAISQVDAAKIGAAKDSMDRMGAAVQGLGNAAAVALAPAIEIAANTMTEFMTTTVAQAGGVEGALAGVAGAFGYIADAAAVAERFTQEMLAGAMDLAGGVMSAVGISAGKEMEKTARTMMEDIERNFAVMPSDKLTKFLADVKAKADGAAQASADLAKANLGAAAGSGVDTLGKSVSELTDKLKEQVAVWGMSAAQADIYKLKAKGASESQLAQAQSAADRLKVLEQEKKAGEEEAKAAQDYWKNTRTAAETYALEVEKINLLRDKGLIDEDTAKRATGKAAKEAGLDDKPKLAGATELASGGGYSMIVSALSGRGSGMNEVVKSGREQVKAQGTTNGLLTKVVNRLTTSPAPQMVTI